MTSAGRIPMSEFVVGEWRIDGNSLSATRNGETRTIEPKAFSVLCYLHERPGQLVTIDTLMDSLWAGTVVTPNAVTRTIAQLRKILDDDAKNPVYIETVARTGYRYIGDEAGPTLSGTRRRRPLVLAGAILLLVALVMSWVLLERNPAELSVAVLPFENLTGDASSDYIGDGVAEELIHSLTGNSSINVVAQRQSFLYRDSTVDLADIASELDVNYIVSGSVRRSGPNLRLTAQLIDPRRGKNLHAVSREVGVLELFDGQDAVSREVTGALLQAAGLPQPVADNDQTSQPNSAAYDLYLQGRHIWHRRGSEPLQPAIDLFREAVDVDPEFARGWSALATAYLNYPSYSPRGYATWHLAEVAAQKALQLDPNIAEPYGVLATFAQTRFEWNQAESLYIDGIRRDPRSATINFWYGQFLEVVGKRTESVRYFRRALDLDPTYRPPALSLTFAYMDFGDYATAARRFESLWNDGFRTAVSWTGNFIVANLNGDAEVARNWVALAPVDDAQKRLLHRFVDASLADADDPALLADMTEYYWHRPDYPIALWLIARLGGHDQVLALANARLDRNFLLEVRPFWAPESGIRQASGFVQLLDRIGLVDYWESSGWGEMCVLRDDRIDCDADLLTPEMLGDMLTESHPL